MKKPTKTSRKTTRKLKKRALTKSVRFLSFLFLIALAYAFLHYQSGLRNGYYDTYLTDSLQITPWEKTKLDRVLKNYDQQIVAHCKQKKLPAPYFLALATLESSGKVPPKKRFEKRCLKG